MNNKLASVFTGAAFMLTLFSSGAALAYAPHTNISARPVVHTAALTPFAMQVFCAKSPRQCAGGGTASQVTATNDLLAVLSKVNRSVNAAIKPRNDRGDSWQVNASSGDCEDYVLTKRAQLIRKGVPAGSLRIATTKTRWGESHAVLVVKTSAGDYVLDNLSDKVKTLRASGYRIRSMSSSDPNRWVAG
ncbi:transglutaminase-like cysteine peptidase [Devosia submarina]|uniref:transglutaminase-like cysteine peptidase n=1 Tax=Devosia submarina TaxID=1173082 RepID=UPI0013008E92|nr:transglutaminase-like cysteine peptidase [Devosia submarina]